jgi:hypothetical protein
MISLDIINSMVFVMETECAYRELGIEFFKIT